VALSYYDGVTNISIISVWQWCHWHQYHHSVTMMSLTSVLSKCDNDINDDAILTTHSMNVKVWFILFIFVNVISGVGSIKLKLCQILELILYIFLSISYKHLICFLQTSYQFLTNILFTSYQFLTKLLSISFKILINLLQFSYEFLINFLSISYKLMNILWIPANFFLCYKNFLIMFFKCIFNFSYSSCVIL
jgi:hypothetical protein